MYLKFVLIFLTIENIMYYVTGEMFLEKILRDHMKNIHYEGTIRPSDNYDTNFTSDHQSIQISVKMVINELGLISETENDYAISLTLNEKWYDKRLILNQSFEFLSLTYFESNIWIPDLYFYNIKSYVTSPKNPSLIWLYQNGTIVFSTTMHIKLYCHMILWRFPLDSQICTMKLGSYGYPSSDLQIKWWHNMINIHKNVNLRHVINTDYHRPIITIEKNNSFQTLNGLFSILTVKFHLKRNFIYHLFYTFLPSTLIVCISWVSFLIDYKAAPARVPFCLLTLLSIMTQWSNINSTLPRLSYLKAVDIWMFICVTFIILSLFEYAIVNKMSISEELKKKSIQMHEICNAEDDNMIDSIKNKDNDRRYYQPKRKLNKFCFENMVTGKRRKNNQKYCLRPIDVDKMAIYIFPFMFFNVNVIYWSILCFVN